MKTSSVYNYQDVKRLADAIREISGETSLMNFPNDFIETIHKYKDNFLDGRTIRSYENHNITKANSIIFSGSTNIETVSMHSATDIGNIFKNCTNLKYVDLPNVVNVGNECFDYCTSLEYLDLPCAKNAPVMNNCTSLLDINFPEATTFSSAAFRNCNSIQNIRLPKVSTIQGTMYAGSFGHCAMLKNVVLGSVTLIKGNNVFQNCPLFEALVITQDSSICALEKNTAFDSSTIKNGSGHIYVPDSLVEAYKTAENWSAYANKIKSLSEYVANGGVL